MRTNNKILTSRTERANKAEAEIRKLREKNKKLLTEIGELNRVIGIAGNCTSSLLKKYEAERERHKTTSLLFSDLSKQIGTRPEGTDSFEQLPRGKTWHEERLNWQDEVNRLRAYIDRKTSVLERIVHVFSPRAKYIESSMDISNGGSPKTKVHVTMPPVKEPRGYRPCAAGYSPSPPRGRLNKPVELVEGAVFENQKALQPSKVKLPPLVTLNESFGAKPKLNMERVKERLIEEKKKSQGTGVVKEGTEVSGGVGEIPSTPKPDIDIVAQKPIDHPRKDPPLGGRETAEKIYPKFH